MAADSTHLVWETFMSLSLLLLKCHIHASSVSEQFQTTAYSSVRDNSLRCLDAFMTVFLSKVQFAELPFTIYVADEDSGYYQATAIAKRCHYFLHESDTFFTFTVASHSCFVKRQKNFTSLNVVIMAPATRGRLEIVKSIPLVCERKIKEATKPHYPPVPRQLFCNEYGFNITISQNVTVPPLNLDSVWIPTYQSHNCTAQKRSQDAVTFLFSFTDCGTQSVVADGIITYWVKIETKRWRKQNVSVFRDTPFHLTVQCSFALAQMTQLHIEVQGETIKYPSALGSSGILRAEMRFAKDSSYKSFFSSREPTTVTYKLGEPVYVEVLVPKHEDKDLVLLLDDCWATATENPHDTQRWNLLVKGCPSTADSHRTVVLPVVSNKHLMYPSLHKWFVVKMFSFVNSPTFENQVHFHCDLVICKGPDCLQSCNSGQRKSRRITPVPGQRIFQNVVSGGALFFSL